MPITEATVYKTSDGVIFDDRDQAIKHERAVDFRAKVVELVEHATDNALTATRKYALVDFVISNKESLFALLDKELS